MSNINPAFESEQDGFLASLASKGIMNETYYQALAFWQCSTREDGIDTTLSHELPNGTTIKLDVLTVPPDIGQTYQIAAQAGYPMITLPAGIALINVAWNEDLLVKCATADEDLQLSSKTTWKRFLPIINA